MYIYIYIYTYTYTYIYIYIYTFTLAATDRCFRKRDSIHHHLLEALSETAHVLELKQIPLCTTPSGWWWCLKSLFRLLLRIGACTFAA